MGDSTRDVRFKADIIRMNGVDDEIRWRNKRVAEFTDLILSSTYRKMMPVDGLAIPS